MNKNFPINLPQLQIGKFFDYGIFFILMGFKEMLQEELLKTNSIPEDLLQHLPRGFQELNRRAILNLKPPLQPYGKEIAIAMHSILHRIEAVWVRSGQIEGKFRQPKGLTHVWGDESTEVIVSENGVRYKFDFTRIMFAKGNTHERSLLPKKIKKGEVIIDMFAGIGYFSLGIAKSKKPQKMYSIEWNPESFKYLQENVKLNHVESIITPIFGDCKENIMKLVKQGVRADRIIMGLLPAPVDAIEYAIQATKDEGTIVIYEGVEPKESTLMFDEFTQIANDNGYETQLLERRLVKAFKPHEYHVVIEILVKKKFQ